MKYKEGARVVTVDGEDVGKLDRVVIHPGTHEVTHLIVRKGFLFKEDKVIPIQMISSSDEDQIQLKGYTRDLDELSIYEELNYIPAKEAERIDQGSLSGYASPYFYYPVVGARPFYGAGYWGGFPTTEPAHPYPMGIEKNIPEDTVAVDAGAKVIDQNEENIGEVAEVIVDPIDNQVTHYVISLGGFSKGEKLIPADWVHSIGEDEIKLIVGEDFIKDLPPYGKK